MSAAGRIARQRARGKSHAAQRSAVSYDTRVSFLAILEEERCVASTAWMLYNRLRLGSEMTAVADAPSLLCDRLGLNEMDFRGLSGWPRLQWSGVGIHCAFALRVASRSFEKAYELVAHPFRKPCR